MAKQMSDDEVYAEAKKRVAAKKGFYKSLCFYLVVNIICVFVWVFASGGGYPWFLWVLCPWGVFVFVHYLRVFVFEKKSDISAIEKEAEKIKREQE